MTFSTSVYSYTLKVTLALAIFICSNFLSAQSQAPLALADTPEINDWIDVLPDLMYSDIDSFFQVVNDADKRIQALKNTSDHSFIELEGKIVSLIVMGFTVESKYDSAIHRIQAFLTSEEMVNADQGASPFYNLLGNLYIDKRDFKEAKRAFLYGLSSNHTPKEEAIILFNLGNIDYYLGAYTSAISHYKNIFLKEEELGFSPLQLATARLSWGAVYAELDSIQLAVAQMEKALQLTHPISENPLRKSILYNLARVYVKAGNMQKAYALLDSAYMVGERQQDHILLTQIHLLKVQNFIAEDRSIPSIKQELSKAEALIQKYELEGFQAGLLSGQANLARFQNKPRLARKYYDAALRNAHMSGDVFLQAGLYNKIAEMDSVLGDMTSAYVNYQRFHHLSDSLKTVKQNEAIDNIKLELELANAKQEKENVSLNLLTSQKLSKSRFYLFLGSVFMLIITLIVLLCILFHRNRIQKISTKMDIQNLRLKSLFQERQLILKLITHDLKSPIMEIQMLVANIRTFLTQEKITEKRLHEDLQEIIDSASNVNELAAQILESDHIIDQVEKDRPKAIDLNQQLQFAVDSYRAKAYKKHVYIKSIPLSTPAISITHQQGLQLIIENILSNAIKYTPPHSQVEIKLIQEKDSYQFEIRDHGPGFTEDDFGKMYQRFQTLSAKPTAGETTYGMGLYLAKKLSKQLGISLEIGNHPQKGALAHLSIPMAS